MVVMMIIVKMTMRTIMPLWNGPGVVIEADLVCCNGAIVLIGLSEQRDNSRYHGLIDPEHGY
jgi:hypothetical protein